MVRSRVTKKSIVIQDTVPTGPVVQEISKGKIIQNRTYADLIKSPLDEELFAQGVTSQILKLNIRTNQVVNLGKPGLFVSLDVSPNGQWVCRMERVPLISVGAYEVHLRVISNTAISLDGRITTVANERFTLGSEADLRLMSQLRNQVDAVLVGGQTFRHWPEPKLPLAKHLAEPMNDGTKWTVLVTRHFAKHVHEDFFSQPNVRMLVFANRRAWDQQPIAKFCCAMKSLRRGSWPIWLSAGFNLF